MQSGETAQSNYAIELAKHFPRGRFAANVVTGRENMGGNETNAETFRFPDVGHDGAEMVELVSETRSLAAGRLERDFSFHFSNAGPDRVEPGDDRLQTCL